MNNNVLKILEVSVENWDFSINNFDQVWWVIMCFGILLLALLLGNLLRNVIPFLRKSLFPTSLIGGFLLIVMIVLLNNFGGPKTVEYISEFQQYCQIITYHCLALGFIAITLKINTPEHKKVPTRSFVKVLENSLMTGGTYMLQAFLGLLVTVIYYFLTKASEKPMFFASGVLLPLSFGQGPGNALSWDIQYSSDYKELFSGNGSFGLALASIGFIVASIVGVFYINLQRRKGNISAEIEKATQELKVEQFETHNEIPDSESVDKLTIQIAMVGFIYFVSFLAMTGLNATGVKLIQDIAWGFNFLFGILFAIVFKNIYLVFKKKGIVKRKYINNYQMDRISGFLFDIMIVAGVAAIKINDIRGYILPIVILSVVGTIGTYLYIRIVTLHCFKEYRHAMFVTNFGTLTGTASNGMILLKEIDPLFETPASSLFVRSQVTSMLTVAPLLLLLGFTGKSLRNSIIAMIIFFVLFVVYTCILFRDKFRKKGKGKINGKKE